MAVRLPAFPKGQMMAEFESVAFALTNKQIIDVVMIDLRV